MNYCFIVKVKGSEEETVYKKLLPFIRSIGRAKQYVTFTRIMNEKGLLDFGEITVKRAVYIDGKKRK